MDPTQSPVPTRNLKTIMLPAFGICLAVLAVFVWLYHFTPISASFLNDELTYSLYLVAALAAAVCGTLLAGQFEKGEPPRRVWLTFSLGWWAWALGELLDLVYNYIYYDTSYPEFTILDACWVAGYFFFGLSLYYQFRLIYDRKKKLGTAYYLPVAALILLVTAGLTQLAIRSGLGSEWSWFGSYLAVFYPVCDLIQGLAALWLSILFGRGRWGRPWWALICFAIADSLSTWFWLGGDVNFSESTQNLFYLFSDTVYISGYLLAALAFLSNYLFHKYGSVQNPLPENHDA
jgi:hypothetical protein